MVLKTFNIDKQAYDLFSKFCRENGISMSKQIEIFIKCQIEEEPKIRKEYLDRLDKIRKGNFVKVADFKKRYLS
ncbi:Uncharacterised protein [uncultured archaeon]|nr:Uncharacterised protein [uncultured archaeon]